MASFNWEVDESKYLTDQEVRILRRVTSRSAERAAARGNKVAVRDWLIIDMAMSTGLRVKELADLRCGDLLVERGTSTVFVRNGKGGKPGWVRFGSSLREHILQYLGWKKSQGEPLDSESPFFISSISGKHLTRRALQMAFKRCMKRAGLRTNLGIHSLRHTYAVMLYQKSKYNLRLVQRQLRHSSSFVTEVYAHVAGPDLERAVERLFG